MNLYTLLEVENEFILVWIYLFKENQQLVK